MTYSIIKFQSISLLFWSYCVDKTQKKPGTKPIYPMDTFSIPSTTGTQGSKYSVFIWMFVVLCLNVQIVYISQIIYVDISCTNKKIMMFNPGKIVEWMVFICKSVMTFEVVPYMKITGIAKVRWLYVTLLELRTF